MTRKRIATCVANVAVGDNDARRIRLALDTGAEVSLARNTPCDKRRPDKISGLTRNAITTHVTHAHLRSDTRKYDFDIHVCPPRLNSLFDALQVDAILGAPELKQLCIDVNYHVAHANKPIRFYDASPRTSSHTPMSSLILIATRIPLRDTHIYQYLDYIDGPGRSDATYSADDVIFDETARGLPVTQRFRQQLAAEYKTVWQRTRDEMPRLLNPKLVPSHEELFTADAKPLRMPPPKMSKARRAYWNRQRKIWLDAGMIVPNPRSQWACIPHQVAKPMRSKTHSHIHDIRPVWNLARTNSRFAKIVPSYPHPLHQIYRILRYRYFFKTDLTKAFSAVGLKPGRTQEATSIWLPTATSYALYSSTRLLLGGKNSATVFQNIFRSLLEKNLSDDAMEHTANFADDIVIAADTLEDLYGYVRQFLDLALTVFLKLNPRKTRIGRTTTFYGFTIKSDGTYCYDDDKLQNFMAATPPRSADGSVIVKELRSFLGVAIQMQRHIPKLATLLQPLHHATRKGTHTWTPELQTAFDNAKKAMSTRRPLHAPDDTRPYFINCDASDAGIGAYLYQKTDDDAERPICFFSRALTVTERSKPVYYREAEALISAIEHAALYMESNPFPLTVFTDQVALTWIFKSEKTKLTSWRLAAIMHIPVNVVYIKGTDNVIADALSRRPFLGQWKFATDLDAALTLLIPRFSPKRIWVYAANQTKDVSDRLRHAWSTTKVYNDAFNHASLGRKRSFDLIVAVPRAHDATRTATLILDTRRPSATLVPTDLLTQIRLPPDSQLTDFTLLVLSDAHYTWILQTTDAPSHTVCTVLTQIPALAGTPEGEDLLQSCGTASDWAGEYTTEDLHPYPKREQTSSGTYTVSQRNLTLTIVPATRRSALINTQHRLFAHASAMKTRRELQRYYIWPTLAADTAAHIRKCICAAARAHHHRAHGNYRDRDWTGPCKRWQVDFKPVTASKAGNAVIMYAICQDARYLYIWAIPSRSTESILPKLRILVNEHGIRSIHSDDERAMKSYEVRGLFKAHRITQTFSHGYHPQSQGTIERVSAFLDFGLRILTAAQYAVWCTFVPRWQRGWNFTYKNVICTTPYEIVFGKPPPHPTAAIGRLDHDNAGFDLHAMTTRVNADRDVFIQIAKWQTLRDRFERTLSLNKSATPITYAEGDAVFYFQPPKRAPRGRRPKHVVQWFPGVVTARRGTLYEVQDITHRTVILRTVQNLSPREHAATDPNPTLRHSILSGEGILLIWDNRLYYAVIQTTNGTQTRVQVYGATKPDIVDAVFRPLYRTARGLLFAPVTTDDPFLTHTFAFTNASSSATHVLQRNVTLEDNGSLSPSHHATVTSSACSLATFH